MPEMRDYTITLNSTSIRSTMLSNEMRRSEVQSLYHTLQVFFWRDVELSDLFAVFSDLEYEDLIVQAS